MKVVSRFFDELTTRELYEILKVRSEMFADEQDYEKTLEYYNTAIEAGDPNGYWSLGTLYEEGLGAEPD